MALIGSRICHDLISPLGAVSNGLELMELSGGGDSPEFLLVRDSITCANARIRFFRIAFGMASQAATLGRTEIARVIDDTFRGTRLAVVWKPVEELPRREVKLAFLCLMCVESALARGGEVLIQRDRNGWRIEATGERFNCPEPLWATVSDPDLPTPRPLAPRDVHFSVLGAHARALSMPVSVRTGAKVISMAF